jgi:hypothetical protein
MMEDRCPLLPAPSCKGRERTSSTSPPVAGGGWGEGVSAFSLQPIPL